MTDWTMSRPNNDYNFLSDKKSPKEKIVLKNREITGSIGKVEVVLVTYSIVGLDFCR